MKNKINRKGEDSGVSELIGAILLVSLVVMLMMIVTTVIISQPRPEKIPELSMSISNTTNNVTITHIGGDTLQGGEYRVVIDGKEINPFYYRENSTSPPKEEWSFEKPTLFIDIPPKTSIEVYYYGSSGEILLAKTTVN